MLKSVKVYLYKECSLWAMIIIIKRINSYFFLLQIYLYNIHLITFVRKMHTEMQKNVD
jgi:hypothetical protein